MTIKKTMNYAAAIFAISIFLIATAPRLFAEHYSIYEGQTQDIKLKSLNQPVTITGAYKELIDLSTGKVLAHSPILNNSENPIYLNPNNEYKINISFTASEDISNFADIGSSLVVNAINSQNQLIPLGAYYNYNPRINENLKLSITEAEDNLKKYKYTYSYIIDSEVFKEIEKTTETYNEKPKYYTLTIGEWANINSRNVNNNVYKTEKNDFISFSNFADIAIKITDTQITQNDDKFTYRLDIPCAIDRTKIILPANIDPNFSGQYKTLCNSSAYFNQETGVYHLKKNEGYYLDLELTNETIEKPDLSKINSVSLVFYKETNKNACFSKTLTVDYKDNTFYHGKIARAEPVNAKEIALEGMDGMIEKCGLNSLLSYKAVITYNDGKEAITQSTGQIKYIMIDSDNSNMVAETARATNVPMTSAIAQRSKETKATEATATRAVSTIAQEPVTSEKELYMTTENKVQKIVPVTQMLEENKIKAEKVVGDINLETESEVPVYVFEVKEQKKLFGFIPIGEKIVEKRISAIKELKE